MAIKNTDMLDSIDRQIEELYIKRAELENAIEQEKREAEKKKKEEMEKELTAIKNAIKEYNSKYEAGTDKLVLVTAKKVNSNSLYSLFPWW